MAAKRNEKAEGSAPTNRYAAKLRGIVGSGQTSDRIRKRLAAMLPKAEAAGVEVPASVSEWIEAHGLGHAAAPAPVRDDPEPEPEA